MVSKVLMEEMEFLANQVKSDFFESLKLQNNNYFNFSIGLDGIPGNIDYLRRPYTRGRGGTAEGRGGWGSNKNYAIFPGKIY